MPSYPIVLPIFDQGTPTVLTYVFEVNRKMYLQSHTLELPVLSGNLKLGPKPSHHHTIHAVARKWLPSVDRVRFCSITEQPRIQSGEATSSDLISITTAGTFTSLHECDSALQR